MGSRVSKAITQVTQEINAAKVGSKRDAVFADCILCEAPRILINVLNLHPKDESGAIFKAVTKCLSVMTTNRSLVRVPCPLLIPWQY